MKNKTVIHRNYKRETELIRSAKKLIELTARAEELLSEVTQGNVEIFDIDAIDKYLNTTTKFINAEMSANALDVLKQYIELKSAILEISKLQSLEVFIKDGELDIQAIELETTVFLSDSKQKEFDRVTEAIDVINKTLTPYTLSKCTNLHREKGLVIDAKQFHIYK